MDRDRGAQWGPYTRMTAEEKLERYEVLRELDIAGVAEIWYERHDYCARDVLIERGALDETSSSSLNDYGHWLVVDRFGATRIHKPLGSRSGRRRNGVMLNLGRHLDIRVHRMVSDAAFGYFALNRKPYENFSGVLTVLLNPRYELREAWVVPYSVIDRHSYRTRMPTTGEWQTTPEVERLYPLEL